MRRISLPPKIEALVNALPFKKKLLIYVGTLIVVIAAFTALLIFPKYQGIVGLQTDLEEAQATLATAKAKAANSERFKAELEATQREFEKALQLLPDQKEIPALLTNISDLGRKAGLEFILFKPKEEVQKDFYAEIPVEIVVLGSYHSVAIFFDKVSKLPRIVNISNVIMTDPKVLDGEVLVRTSCLATTYRFTGTKADEGDKAKKEGDTKA